MIPQVLQAVQAAFGTEHVVNGLRERKGRIFGSVEVQGSALFDDLDDVRRQMRLWDALREQLGAEATQVGPIVLEPTNLG